MENNFLKQFNATGWFYLFLVIHLVCWTLAPILVRNNLPLDAIEGTIWGQQLQLGYDKDPFLNGWLSALAIYLGGQSGWMLYLFCQLCIAASLWSVWEIGKKILTPVYALISVMLLEGIQYINFHALDFNDNTLELGFWSLTIYFFYRALSVGKTQVSINWLMTGLFAGLAMMSKYYTLALLASMTLFLVCRKENRQHLTTAAPYLGLLIFSLIILPHVVWLFSHDFVTVHYVFARASSEPHWTNHINFPFQFALEQFQVFIPSMVLFGLLLIGKRPVFRFPKIKITSFDKSFLLFVCLGPFILTILLSFFAGIKLRAGWGMPLLSFWSLILIAWTQPALSEMKIYRFIATIFLFMALLLGGYVFSLINSSTPTTANFPGKEIATLLTQKWRDLYHTKLDYVAGSRWVGGNIEFYSPDHPAVFIEWSNRKSAWIDNQDLEKKGAIFIWDIDEGENPPRYLRKRYPRLLELEILEVEWQRNTHNLPPIQIGVAILPPGK